MFNRILAVFLFFVAAVVPAAAMAVFSPAAVAQDAPAPRWFCNSFRDVDGGVKDYSCSVVCLFPETENEAPWVGDAGDQLHSWECPESDIELHCGMFDCLTEEECDKLEEEARLFGFEIDYEPPEYCHYNDRNACVYQAELAGDALEAVCEPPFLADGNPPRADGPFLRTGGYRLQLYDENSCASPRVIESGRITDSCVCPDTHADTGDGGCVSNVSCDAPLVLNDAATECLCPATHSEINGECVPTPDAPFSASRPGTPSGVWKPDGAVSVFWAAPADAGVEVAGYEVWRDADSGGFMSVGYSPTLWHADANTRPGTTLRYRVRIAGGGTESDSAESAAVVIPDECVPNRCDVNAACLDTDAAENALAEICACRTNFLGDGESCRAPPSRPGRPEARANKPGPFFLGGYGDRVHLDWQPPLHLNGATITRYEVLREDDYLSGSFSSVAAVPTPSYDDHPLPYRVTLRYQVRAHSDAGPSPYSQKSEAVVTRTPAPPLPPKFRLIHPGVNAVWLVWETSDYINGGAMLYHDVFREENLSGDFVLIGEAPENPGFYPQYVDWTPPAPTTVRYKIRTISDQGPSEFSEASWPVFVPAELPSPSPTSRPGKPRVLRLVARMMWEPPLTLNFAVISHYEVLREEDLSGVFVSVGVASAEYEHRVPSPVAPLPLRTRYADLTAPISTTLRYQVRAHSNGGASPFSEASDPIFTRMSVDPPSPPGKPVLHHNPDYSVFLQWTEPEDLNGAEISSYHVLREVNMSGEFEFVEVVDSQSYLDFAPPSNSTVRYQVQAESDLGLSKASEASEAAVIPPAAYYSHIPRDGRGGTLSADGLIDNYSGALASAATVTFRAAPAADYYVAEWSHPGCSELGTPADGGEKVCALPVAGDLFVTATFSPTLSLPGTPLSLSAAADGAGVVTLSWLSATTGDGGAAGGYEVQRAAGLSVFVSVAYSASLSYVDEVAPLGVSLRYRVRGVNASGAGAFSAASGAVLLPRDCAGERRLAHSGGDGSLCGDCVDGHGELGGYCVPRLGDFAGLLQAEVCRALGGRVLLAEGGSVCSGVDRAGTFCVLDSAAVFPCRGLFQHVRDCNLKYGRPGGGRWALNPFLCGPACGSGSVARGGKCCATANTPLDECAE